MPQAKAHIQILHNYVISFFYNTTIQQLFIRHRTYVALIAILLTPPFSN